MSIYQVYATDSNQNDSNALKLKLFLLGECEKNLIKHISKIFWLSVFVFGFFKALKWSLSLLIIVHLRIVYSNM